MRFKNGFALFSRTNSRGHWNLASWHSPHSMTWRWILTFSRFHSDEARMRPLWWSFPTNQGPHWGFRIPFVGMVSWQTQRPMWYRDCYQRLRDRVDFGHHRDVEPEPPLPSPPRLSVIDGGQSVH